MTTQTQLFCPHCHSYLGALAAACFCGWRRPRLEALTRPNQPLWQASLGGPARGRALAAGGLILFAWGSRGAGGGVSAFDALSGAPRWARPIQTPGAVEGGLALEADRLLFGTLSFLGRSAELRCHRLQDGGLLWSKTVEAGVWSAPLVRDQRVYVGCEDGRVHCFDLEGGRSVPGWPVQLDPGRLWLALEDDRLAVVSQTGKIYALHPLTGVPIWGQPVNLAEEIKSGPVVSGGQLVVGSLAGRLHSLTLRNGRAQLLAHGLGEIVAAPVYHEGRLYVGARDRQLYALDARSGAQLWKRDCQRGIAASALVAQGLVYAVSNAGNLYAFEAESGDPLGQYALDGAPLPLLASPACSDGVIHLGAENGRVCALPWHLGHYAWAAGHLSRLEQPGGAASLFAISSDLELNDLVRKESLGQAAIQHWQIAGERALAARYRESLLGQSAAELAGEFEEAGKLLKDPDLLRRAAGYYGEAEDEPGSRRCARMAGQLSHAPYLGVQLVNLPPGWEAGEEGEVVFEIKNRGESPAENIRIRLAGNLALRLWIELSGHLAPGQGLELAARIVPTGPGSLVIEPHFTDLAGAPWSDLRHFPFEDVRPSTVTLDVSGDVGVLELDESLLQKKVRIRGDAALIQVKSVGVLCPACGKTVQQLGRRCQECGAEL